MNKLCVLCSRSEWNETWFINDKHFDWHSFLSEMVFQCACIKSTITTLHFGYKKFGYSILDRHFSISIGFDGVSSFGEGDLW